MGNGWLHFTRSGSGNGRVAPVTPSPSHRPSRCHDSDCPRAACRWYRDGYDDGNEDGFEDGYRRGYAAGAAAEQKG
jgi:hypothetical protein